MPGPLGTEALIAGAYNVTWNSQAFGLMEADQNSPAIEYAEKEEPVANSHTYGKSTIEGFYLGADVFASFICMEYKSATTACWWPWGTLGLMGIISRTRYNMSAALVLTAVAGTPAAATPTSLTGSKALLAPGYNTKLLFGPTLRKLPIRQQLLPYDTGGGVIGWFTTT